MQYKLVHILDEVFHHGEENDRPDKMAVEWLLGLGVLHNRRKRLLCFFLLVVITTISVSNATVKQHTLTPSLDKGLAKSTEKSTTLEFDSGTKVVVYAPKYVDAGQLQKAAELVQKMALKTACTCFCRMHSTISKSHDASDPYGEFDCICRENDSGAIIDPKRPTPRTDAYGQPKPASSELKVDNGKRFLYEHTDGVGFTLDGLLFTLDAGDRQSYNPAKNASEWLDVSGIGAVGSLTGSVSFNKTEGGGSIRFGAGGAERATLDIDISPQAHPELTLEVWLKLTDVANDVGWVLGHDRPRFGKSSLDRGLLVHDIRFQDSAEKKTQSLRAKKRQGPLVGRSAIGVGHVYASNLPPPVVGDWIQLVGVWTEGGDSMLYRDTMKDRISRYTRSGPGERYLTIGAHPQLKDQGVDGYIALVRAYDRALSDDEIRSNYVYFAKRFGLAGPKSSSVYQKEAEGSSEAASESEDLSTTF